jgi:ADP-heptose:LPS heptosyltransferase
MRNQYEKYEARLLDQIPGDGEIYNEVLNYFPEGNDASVCRDIMNYRFLLAKYFPEDAQSNKNAFPRIPEYVTGDATLHAKAREKGSWPDTGPFLAVCPFATQAIRMYPLDRLASAASQAAKAHNLSVIIIGTEANASEAGRLASLMAPGIRRISLAGKLTILEAISCIARATAVIAMESAGAHIAIASGVPSVIILGGGHYGHFGPWGSLEKTRWLTHKLECFGCNWNCTQARPYCIENVTPDAMMAAFDQVMKYKKT